MTSFYKIIYRAFRVNQPHQANQNPNNWTYHKSSAYISYGNTKKALEAIPELPKRGGRKIQPASAASAQREYEKLTQIGGILLHMVQIAIQNI